MILSAKSMTAFPQNQANTLEVYSWDSVEESELPGFSKVKRQPMHD